MRYAVVGSGLAGLGACYFLKQKGCNVSLFNKKGTFASGIASGLLHPYPGKKGLLSKYGFEALNATIQLIDRVEELGEQVALRNGIMKDGELISSGITVFMDKYLKGLQKYLGLEVQEMGNLEHFDHVVYAMGAGFREYNFDLPIQYIKGQILTVASKEKWERSTIHNGHISPLAGGGYQIGSTYEHHFESDEPNLQAAWDYLEPRVTTFSPFTVLACKAAVRVAVKGSYLPIVKKIDDRSSIFTGLGSRGLLYHAYYGRHLADLIT